MDTLAPLWTKAPDDSNITGKGAREGDTEMGEPGALHVDATFSVSPVQRLRTLSCTMVNDGRSKDVMMFTILLISPREMSAR
jgi:hypothetical protein